MRQDSESAFRLPRAVVAAGAAAALLAAGERAVSARMRRAGDEAPIRVKNFSIDIEVVHAGRTWSAQSRKHFRMSGREKGSDLYEIYLAPTDPAACHGTVRFEAGAVDFRYTDGNVVRIESVKKKSEVTSTNDLALSSDRKRLAYSPAGHIEAILIGGSEVCTFRGADRGLSIVLVDK